MTAPCGWDPKKSRDKNELLWKPYGINSMEFSSDGKRLATGGLHRNWVEVWDVPGRRWMTNLSGQGFSTTYSPGGKVLAAGGFDNNNITLWNGETLEPIGVLTNNFWSSSIAFSPDGRVLAAARFMILPPDGLPTLSLWDVASKRQLMLLPEASTNAGVVAFSHQGQILAIGYLDGWVRLWDWQARRELSQFHGSGVWALAFSPDDNLLACAAGDAVLLYDLGAKRVSKTLTGHSGGAFAVSFTPDGKTLVSAGNEGTIRLWNLLTGEIALTLTHPQRRAEPIYSLAFTRDGTLMASGGLDGEVRLWPASSPAETSFTQR